MAEAKPIAVACVAKNWSWLKRAHDHDTINFREPATAGFLFALPSLYVTVTAAAGLWEPPGFWGEEGGVPQIPRYVLPLPRIG